MGARKSRTTHGKRTSTNKTTTTTPFGYVNNFFGFSRASAIPSNNTNRHHTTRLNELEEEDFDYGAIPNSFNPTLAIFSSDDTDNDTEAEAETEVEATVQLQTKETNEIHGTNQNVQIILKGLELSNVGVCHCYQLKATVSLTKNRHLTLLGKL